MHERAMPNTVQAWFGSAFGELHPLLQRLHSEGGVLSGPVQVSFGRGVAGFIGKRLAAKLGVPTTGRANELQVFIHSGPGTLHWNRKFNGQAEFKSTFVPVGRYPAGHWIESSGLVRLRLQVAVVGGGWRWVHAGTRIGGVPLPRWLMPRTTACKEVVDDVYRFHVEVAFPVVGTVMMYSGNLAAEQS